jgi:hypothetical protein
MASLNFAEPTTLQNHLEEVHKRKKKLQKLSGWPEFGSFTSGKELFVSELIDNLEKTLSLEDYYTVLNKAQKALGNQLQDVCTRKASMKFYKTNLGQNVAIPSPDLQLHYFMRLAFERIMAIYAERITEALKLTKPKKFPPVLLDVYLHEIRVLEQQEMPSSSVMMQYLEQWGANVWPPVLRASDIVPRSWSLCVAKMKQILDLEWKPAPLVTVVEDDGETIKVADDSKSLQSFVDHRAFFLGLFLYCTVHPAFFASNFESLASKVKESVLGDLIVQWVGQRAEQFKSMESKPEQ